MTIVWGEGPSGKVKLRLLDDGSLSSGSVSAASVPPQIASGTASVQVVAANPARRGLILHNTDANAALIKYGTAASATSFTARLLTNTGWSMPAPIYTGVVHAIWEADGAGFLAVTEL